MNFVVYIHCSREVDSFAQEQVKKHSYGDEELDIEEHTIYQFLNETDDGDEVAKYGKREALRTNSPFFSFFVKFIDDVSKKEMGSERISNPFYCPELMRVICKQYLALFPFITACLLPQDRIGLRNNAFVELYWEEQKRMLSKVPKRLLWPPQYLGMLYNDSQSKATEILLKGCIPNIRSGGKVKASQQKVASFIAGIEGQNFSMRKNAQVCNDIDYLAGI